MYRIGDVVLCQDVGLCRILNISPFCCDNLTYEMQPLFGPHETQTLIFQKIRRPALTREKAEALLEAIPSLSPLSPQEVPQAAQGHDPTRWVMAFQVAAVDAPEAYDLLRRCWDILVQELSLALELPFDQAQAQLRSLLP